MSPDQERMSILKEQLSTLARTVTKSEFLAAFENVLKFAQGIKKSNDTEFSLIKSAISMLTERLKNDNEKDITDTKKQALSLIEKALKEQDRGMKFIYDKVSRIKEGKDGEDGKDGRDGTDGEDGKPGKDAPFQTAEDVRNKLELLQGEERLDASAIKGLEEYDKRIKGLENRPNVGGWSSASGGKIMKYYDLSPLLDGLTTTFSLPAFWRVISVESSSFPNAFRQTVDYTVDGTLFQITFTSQINPATTLAAGQTLVVLYAEP